VTPCPTSSQMERYAAGELPAAEADEINRHVERCLSCAERLANVSSFDRLLRDVKEASQEETVDLADMVHVEKTGSEQDPLVGKVIGDFEIRKFIGSGGMGAVYEAEQISLKRRVALKVLSAPIGAKTAGVLRFTREAQAAARLHHTNIVSVFSQGQTGGLRYYAMEIIDGTGLDQLIRELRRRVEKQKTIGSRRPLANRLNVSSWRRRLTNDPNGQDVRRQFVELDRIDPSKRYDLIARLVADVADALDYAHKQGVIHRDVKPSNMILGADGRLSLTDFGLARMMEQPGMTIAGEFLGSPLYMSPEQVAAGRVTIDRRTDIYSLGATLYELLCMRPPYNGETREQVIGQIREGRLRRPRKIDKRIPHDLETVCLKAMQLDPRHRYQTAGEMADDLRRFVNRYAIRARRATLFSRIDKLIRRHAFESAMLGAICITVLAAGLISLRYKQLNAQAETELQLAEGFAGDLWKRWEALRLEQTLQQGHTAVAYCQFREARKVFGDVIRRAQKQPVGYLARGLTAYVGEIVGVDSERSGYREDFRAALRLQPSSAILDLLSRLPGPGQACRSPRETLEPLLARISEVEDSSVNTLTHGHPALVYLTLAWVAFAGGNDALALKLSDQAMAAQPELAVGCLVRAMILLRMRQYVDARDEAAWAIRLLAKRRPNEPKNLASVYFLRATVMTLLGLPEQALKQTQKAMAILAERRSRMSSPLWSGSQPTTSPALSSKKP